MTDDLRIRPATAGDLAALGALKLRASLAYGDLVEELRDLPDAREVPAAHLPHVFLAEAGGAVLGFATVLPKTDEEAELEDIFVDPQGWRSGVGRALMDEAARRTQALGAGALHVIANERARAFYEACGFRQIGTVETLFEPAPTMRLELG